MGGTTLDGLERRSGLPQLTFAANHWGQEQEADGSNGWIDVSHGEVVINDVDLVFPAAVPWVVGRTYRAASGLPLSNTQGYQGRNWFQSSQPEVVRSTLNGSNYLFLIYGADRHLAFRQWTSSGIGSNTYRGVNGVAGAMIVEETASGPDFIRYFDQDGREAIFFGFDNDSGSASGQLWKFVDATGQQAFVGHLSDPGLAIQQGYSAAGKIAVAFDSTGKRFSYTYNQDGRVSSVCAHSPLGGSGWEEYGRVDYVYYASAGANGDVGDLALVKVTTPTGTNGNPVTTRRHYRYDSTGGIRMVVNPEGCRRYGVAVGGSDTALLAALDPAVRDYATLEVAYDQQRRVYSTVDAAAPLLARTYEYASNAAFVDSPTDYDTTWKIRTTTTNGTSYSTTYFDEYAQRIGSVITNGPLTGYTQVWPTRIYRDSNGRILQVRTPANSSVYTPSPSCAEFVTGSESNGMVFKVDRLATGPMTGFPSAVWRSSGTGNGTQSKLVEIDYWSSVESNSGKRRVGAGEYDIRRPLVSAVRQFVGNGFVSESSMAYQFHSQTATEPGALRIKVLAQQLPPIDAARNGPGTPITRLSYYDLSGAKSFERSPSGRIHWTLYDPATGLVQRTIQDCDPAMMPVGFPDGISPSVPGPGDPPIAFLHRDRQFTYDPFGRLTRASVPGGRVLGWSYLALADGRRVVLEIPRIEESQNGSTFYGPAVGSVFSHEGRPLGKFIVGPPIVSGASVGSTTTDPASWLDTGRPDLFKALSVGGFDRGHYVLFDYDQSGTQLQSIRRFHQTPEDEPPVVPPFQADPRGPAVSRSFDRMDFGYDATGRLYRTMTPAGGVTELEFDALGRLAAEYKYAIQTPAQKAMTAAFEWDNGMPGGNSLLTRISRFTDGTGPSRETRLVYDTFGRPVGIQNPAEPHSIFAYDNADRITAWARVKGAVLPLPLPHPGSENLSGRIDYRETLYDEHGRSYRDLRYPVNPQTGAIAWNSTLLESNRYFGTEGALRAETGTVNVLYARNRACELTKCTVYASLSPITGYADAISLDGDDYVLAEHHYIIDRHTGELQGAISCESGPPSCDFTNSAATPLLPPGMVNPTPGGFTLGNPDTAVAQWPHTMQVGMIWRDTLGRPGWKSDLGDPRYLPSPGSVFPLVYNRDLPTTFASGNPLNARISASGYDSLGRPRISADSPDSADEFGYDGAGRLTSVTMGRAGALGPYGGVVFFHCQDDPKKTIGYDDGRPGDQRICNGIDCGDSKGIQPIYPDQLSEAIGAPTWYDPNVPWGILLDDPNPLASIPNDWIAGNSPVVRYEHNLQNELTSITEVSGLRREITLDPLGRERERLTIPPPNSNTPAIRDVVDYDPYSGLRERIQRFDETNTLRASTQSTRNEWGLTTDVADHLFDQRIPGGLQYRTHIDFDMLSPPGGWSGPRVTSMTMPGGMPVFPRYNLCNGVAPPQGAPTLNSQIGRPTRFDVGMMLPFHDGPPWHTPSNPPQFTPPAPNPMFGAVEMDYYGVFHPREWKTATSANDPNTLNHNPYHGVYFPTPDGSSGLNRWGEPSRERVCNGISCGSGGGGAPWLDRTINRDGQGRVTTITDGIETLSSIRNQYIVCTNTLTAVEGNDPPAYGTPSSENSNEIRTSEKFVFDRSGALLSYAFDDDKNVDVVDAGDERRVSTYNGRFQRTSTQITRWDPETAQPVTHTETPLYDPSGNQISDGLRWHFGYDAEHRLVEVRRRQADGSPGAVFGKFTYDALGRRASAVYDDSGDGNLDNETVEYFAYDPAWRLSCIYRQGPADEFGVRPAPVAYERFLYADGGLRGSDALFTPGFALDCPTHSQIDANADGTFERTRRFILNHFGDVAGVIEDHAPGAWSYELAEVVRYSPTGLPRVIGHFGADIDESGGSPDDADVAAFFALYGAGDPRADFNGSGGTPDEADVELFFQVWDAGIGQGTPDDNRFGWRGYLWDARLGLYHVRHRVYDPRHAAWLTPDPAGYIDGLNLYAYCRGDLVNKFDPWGLWFEEIATQLVNSDNAAVRGAGYTLGVGGGFFESYFTSVYVNNPNGIAEMLLEMAYVVIDQGGFTYELITGNRYDALSELGKRQNGGTWADVGEDTYYIFLDAFKHIASAGLIPVAHAIIDYTKTGDSDAFTKRMAQIATGNFLLTRAASRGRTRSTDNGGVLDGAKYAQRYYSEYFSSRGRFSNMTINDVAAALRSGKMKVADVPIEYIVLDYTTLMLNTRSAQALTRAGIPRRLWKAIDASADALAHKRLLNQLRRNKLGTDGIDNPASGPCQ